MKKTLLTTIRNKKINILNFRKSSEKIAHILAQESFQYIKENKISIDTPLLKTDWFSIKDNIVLIPILRSWLAFLPIFLYYFEEAKVGFYIMKRDEKTAIAKEYYKNLPKINKKDLVLILDPMLATWWSAALTINWLIESWVKESQIIFVCLVAAPEWIKLLNKKFPKVKLIIYSKDKKLNKDKFILPGLWDFWDRYFGTL